METIESLHERVEVLDHQIEALIHRSRLIECKGTDTKKPTLKITRGSGPRLP